MAEHSYTPDFLRRHRSLGGRVRALETGVHPLPADVDYLASMGPVVFPVLTGWTTNSRYRVRQGVGILDGYAQRNFAIGGSVALGELPEEVRPLVTMTMIAAWVPGANSPTDDLPSTTRVSIDADTGEVTVYNDSGETGNWRVALDGISWPVG